MADLPVPLGSPTLPSISYKVKVKVILRLTVSRPVCLGDKHPSEAYWSSPAMSFLGPSPAGLVTIFYSFRFETPSTWRARSSYNIVYPPGTWWPSYTPGTGFPFRRKLRLEGLRWRYSNPLPRGSQSQSYIATDGRSISMSWCRAPSGAHDHILLLFDSCGLVFVGRRL
jgi:hypothetical protein